MFSKITTEKSMKSFFTKTERLKQALDSCDAVLIGAGAGLSTSAGFDYGGKRFEKNFGDFERKYGFHDMYSGGFYPFETPEEFWAFWSRNIWLNRYMPAPGDVYKKLFELIKDKDYFVLTTNVDHQFQLSGFDKKRLFYTQGDYGLFQCSKPCCEKTYDNKEAIEKMVKNQKEMKIPSELVPKCPVCGAEMTTNLRCDNRFVQDDGWYAAASRYSEFLRRHKGLNVLFLELGVGENTPAIIKYPFWQMTAENKNAVYVCINKGQAVCPEQIRQQSICIDADIGSILTELS